MNKIERLWSLRHWLLLRLDHESANTAALMEKLDRVEALLQSSGAEV